MLFSFGLNYAQRGEINALKIQEKFYQYQNRLLVDQIREYEYKAITNRTYEDGLTQGLVRSANVGYVDGYHAAMNQAEESRALYAEQERIKAQEALAEKNTTIESSIKNATPVALPTSNN